MALDDEQDLIRRCRQGHLEAFERIYCRYERPLLTVAWRLLDTREAAEDAVQDAMVKAFRRIGQFRQYASLSTWLYRIVVNTCYDRLRRRKQAARVDLDLAADLAGDDDAEMRTHLQAAIAGLAPNMKTCFVLYAQEGYRQREIAEMLGLQEGTVKAHVFRAREQLRVAMTDRLRGWTR